MYKLCFLAKAGENMFAFFTLNRIKHARQKQLSHIQICGPDYYSTTDCMSQFCDSYSCELVPFVSVYFVVLVTTERVPSVLVIRCSEGISWVKNSMLGIFT